MIFIYKDLIREYIPKLTMKDLERFAHKKNIEYTQDELVQVFEFIQYYYNDLLDENIKVFEQIRNKISPNLYKTLLHLYIDYKQKYFS